jgi:threonine synthase
VRPPASIVVCAGCGTEVPQDDPYPFACPHAGEGDVDHVLQRRLDLSRTAWPGNDDPRPFVRFRTLLHSYRFARAHGMSDARFVRLVERLDDRVATVDGTGFRTTPFMRSGALEAWVKDETHNVSGSHKARHLFGVLLQLEVVATLGLGQRRTLAIASCGNAALAAAVVAAAAGRVLNVFVPEDAEPEVLARLEALGARVTVCPRDPAVPGDPTVARLRAAFAQGWELAASGVELDRVVVQVGGGALASAVAAGLQEAWTLGAIERLPRIDTVQTRGAWPLKRAYDAVRAHPGGLAYARTHRSEFMWPWETPPESVAHGILDDETYDWAAVCEALSATGGDAVVVDEEMLRSANALGRNETGIPADPTGTSGLAGLLALREAGAVGGDERVAVLFTGVDRTLHSPTEGRIHEEFPGTRHPVAQGL